MKIEFVETQYETCLTLYPETVDEVGQLYRMAKNSKAEKPYLSIQFNNESGKKIYGHVQMQKLRPESNKVITKITNQ